MTKHIDKAVRAQKIKELTSNGKNRRMVRRIEKLMEDPETCAMMNALFAATSGKKGK